MIFFIEKKVHKNLKKGQPNRLCELWREDPNILCFSCQACKTGFEENIKINALGIGFLFIFNIICTIIVFITGIYA